MANEEEMRDLAKNIYELGQLEKEIKGRKEELRKQLFDVMADDYRDNPHLLPTRSIQIPDTFWDRTTMTEDSFFTNRFPGWLVEETQPIEGGNDYTLRRDATHMPYSVEIETDDGNDIKVSKEINEYTPSMDWETLHDELPELFQTLARSVEIWEINEDELERLVQIEPDVLSKLQRHMNVREPATKMTTRPLKKDS